MEKVAIQKVETVQEEFMSSAFLVERSMGETV